MYTSDIRACVDCIHPGDLTDSTCLHLSLSSLLPWNVAADTGVHPVYTKNSFPRRGRWVWERKFRYSGVQITRLLIDSRWDSVVWRSISPSLAQPLSLWICLVESDGTSRAIYGCLAVSVHQTSSVWMSILNSQFTQPDCDTHVLKLLLSVCKTQDLFQNSHPDSVPCISHEYHYQMLEVLPLYFRAFWNIIIWVVL